MDKFERKEMKNEIPVIKTWYEWLFNCILESIRKSVGGFKDKVVSLFKRNTPMQTLYGRGKKLSIQKSQEQLKDRIIRDITTLFEQGNDYYKPIRVGNFWNNNYIDYESNGDRNKNLSLKEYLKRI